MTYNRRIRRNTILLLTALFLAAAFPREARSQHTHRQINLEAVKLFLSHTKGKEKHRIGSFADTGASNPAGDRSWRLLPARLGFSPD
ncbi:hypothetical protein MASR2M79_24380 [Aminivibrio sp.]